MPAYLPFREVAALWKENKSNMVKHSTYCAYMLILKTHLLPKFGDSETISESDAQQFVLDSLRSGLSRKSVHDVLSVLKAIAKYGAKHSIFDFPAWEIEYPTETAPRHLPVLSLHNHKNFLANCRRGRPPKTSGL